MYYKYIHEPKPLYIKDRIQKKSYKNTIYYLIGRVELLSEHENLTKVKNMYKPIIDEYYSIQDDTIEMPDELYQIIIKSIDLLLEDIDRDTQRRVDRLTSLLEKIEGDEKMIIFVFLLVTVGVILSIIYFISNASEIKNTSLDTSREARIAVISGRLEIILGTIAIIILVFLWLLLAYCVVLYVCI